MQLRAAAGELLAPSSDRRAPLIFMQGGEPQRLSLAATKIAVYVRRKIGSQCYCCYSSWRASASGGPLAPPPPPHLQATASHATDPQPLAPSGIHRTEIQNRNSAHSVLVLGFKPQRLRGVSSRSCPMPPTLPPHAVLPPYLAAGLLHELRVIVLIVCGMQVANSNQNRS